MMVDLGTADNYSRKSSSSLDSRSSKGELWYTERKICARLSTPFNAEYSGGRFTFTVFNPHNAPDMK